MSDLFFECHDHFCFSEYDALNNGHIGKDDFFHYREVALFQRQKVYCHCRGYSIRKCSLNRGVPYSECPLSKVPLYTIVCVERVGRSCDGRRDVPIFPVGSRGVDRRD